MLRCKCRSLRRAVSHEGDAPSPRGHLTRKSPAGVSPSAETSSSKLTFAPRRKPLALLRGHFTGSERLVTCRRLHVDAEFPNETVRRQGWGFAELTSFAVNRSPPSPNSPPSRDVRRSGSEHPPLRSQAEVLDAPCRIESVGERSRRLRRLGTSHPGGRVRRRREPVVRPGLEFGEGGVLPGPDSSGITRRCEPPADLARDLLASAASAGRAGARARAGYARWT